MKNTKKNRRIFGPLNENEIWRRRYNHETYQLFKEAPISEFVRLQRLRWAGHVVRLPDNRLPKRALNSRMQGRRPKGRPRKRWEDGVTEDAQKLDRCQNLEESGVGSTVLEAEDKGDQGSIWAVAPLER